MPRAAALVGSNTTDADDPGPDDDDPSNPCGKHDDNGLEGHIKRIIAQ